ncbi:hypothetical protein Pla175_31680 [Pirellulimonas nuda]|uniref:PEP-CTERM protein-sorting domain-containing protein n=1 Tax=Pirellulimonas nuda TaxID=2528009 RepID=A0A518DE89_9BACT|nr:hypothetical protein [Pirellulimonas nuda]QDU89773.1 hypothetical protein Pla175_31680 [Pirellulimonas nuda]
MKASAHTSSRTLPVCLLVATAALALSTNGADAQIFLTNTDDANTSNDTSRGPTTTNDRSDFNEIRNFFDGGTTTRKKIGYYKFDISGINPILFPFATLSTQMPNGRDSAGVVSVYGLNDAVTNTDNVPDGTYGEADWTESTLSYSRGLGVDTSVATTDGYNLGIDPNETTLLGVINHPAKGPDLTSNTTDLPLGAFLAADTNGFVTFMLAGAATGSPEWRTTARENSAEDTLRLVFNVKTGDTNLNGTVDLDDLTPIRTNYRNTGLSYTDGDLNSDNIVDLADFRLWKTGLLAEGGSLAGIDLSFATAVPEPSTACLAAVAGLFFCQRGFRRRVGLTSCN